MRYSKITEIRDFGEDCEGWRRKWIEAEGFFLWEWIYKKEKAIERKLGFDWFWRERQGNESWLRFAEGGDGSRAKIDREDNVMGRSTKEEIL